MPSPDEAETDASGLPTVADLGRWMRFRKGSLPGNALAAAYRMRRVPRNAFASARAARADARVGHRPRGRSGRFDGVYLIPAGPGDWEPLRDTLESVLHYEGERSKAIVVDDGSIDCRAAAVQDVFPQVDVLRRPWPSGGPPRNLPIVVDGIRHALRHYEFDVLLKIDTDALVTGASPSAAAAEYFRANPSVGMAGTIGRRADGREENYEWDEWVLPHTARWSRSVRRLMERARAGGYDGTKVHGGVYALSRPALEAMVASGELGWSDPWWTPLGEDFWISVLVLASGYGLGSMGDVGEPFAVASKHTPISNREVLAQGKLAIHSVRQGAGGEDEEQMRAFFRATREGGQDRPGSAAGASAMASDSAIRPPGR